MSYLSKLQLCESTSGALGGHVSIDKCLSVWHSVGKAIKTQLGANKGVRLPLLGNFSLTASGKTAFTAATELLRNYRLKTPGCAAAGNFRSVPSTTRRCRS